MNEEEKRQYDEHRKTYTNLTDVELLYKTMRFSYHDVRSYTARQILNERKESIEKARADRAETQIAELKSKVDELKKPHWTVLPIFWFTFLSLLISLIAYFRPSQYAAPDLQHTISSHPATIQNLPTRSTQKKQVSHTKPTRKMP